MPRATKQTEKGASCPRVQLEMESKGLIVTSDSRSGIVTSMSPAFNMRECGGPNTITQESINGAMEKTKCNILPARLSSRIYLLQLLCEFAGVVMDKDMGE